MGLLELHPQAMKKSSAPYRSTGAPFCLPRIVKKNELTLSPDSSEFSPVILPTHTSGVQQPQRVVLTQVQTPTQPQAQAQLATCSQMRAQTCQQRHMQLAQHVPNTYVAQEQRRLMSMQQAALIQKQLQQQVLSWLQQSGQVQPRQPQPLLAVAEIQPQQPVLGILCPVLLQPARDGVSPPVLNQQYQYGQSQQTLQKQGRVPTQMSTAAKVAQEHQYRQILAEQGQQVEQRITEHLHYRGYYENDPRFHQYMDAARKLWINKLNLTNSGECRDEIWRLYRIRLGMQMGQQRQVTLCGADARNTHQPNRWPPQEQKEEQSCFYTHNRR